MTGTYFDVDRISILCHKYDTLVFYDYAAVGPYLRINMNDFNTNFPLDDFKKQNKELCYMDAIFFSPHKFVGGPGASGILLVKKGLMYLNKPHRLGGGIVEFVNRNSHIYVNNPEIAEEAGTPNIIGDIRAGLVFKVKEFC